MRAPQPRTASRREEARAVFRNAVLGAAEEVFAERGFHGAHMKHIAERARVSVGTVYNHFEQKDDVLRALLAERSCGSLEAMRPREGDPADFAGRLRARLHRVQTFVAQHRGFFTLAFDQGLLGAESASPDARARRKRELLRELMGELVESGIASGELRAVNPVQLTRFLVGAWRTVMLGALHDRAEDLDGSVDFVVDLFLGGARAPRRSTRT